MSDKVVLQGEVTLVQSIDGDAELTIIADGDAGTFMPILPVLQDNKTATPTEQVQQITPDTQYNGLRKVTVEAIPSDYVGSAITRDPEITVDGPEVSIPEGYYSEDNTATVQTAMQATPTIEINGAQITATTEQAEGYVEGGTKTTTATITTVEQATPTLSVSSGGLITATATQSAGLVPSGTKTATSQLSTQAGKTVTPTESQQTAVATGKYTTGTVKVGAIPSNYVGSGIPRDPTPTVSGDTVNIPTGYYTTNTSKAVQTVAQATPSMSTNGATVTATVTQGEGYVSAGTKTASATVTAGTAGTPTATKGTVSNHSVTVTPSVTNTTGYITGGTITGTGVSVSASELVSGTLSITDNGTADVTNYANIDVNVAGGGGAIKLGVIRPDAELVQKWTYDKRLVADEGITLPSAYSTTSQTLKAAATIATYNGDPSAYRYFIVQRCLTIPVYNITTLAKGREEYVYSVYGGEWVYQPQGELCTLDGTKTYGQYSQITATGAFTREVLWNSATALNVYTSPAYCLAQNIQAPAISSNKTITIKSPTVTIRGHATYLTQTFYEAITDARLQYVIELWRVPIDTVLGWITGSQMRSLYDDIANNGGTLR